MNLTDIKQLITKYNTSYFLSDYNALNYNYLLQKDWLIKSSFSESFRSAIALIDKSENFGVKNLINQGISVVLNNNNLYLLKADCIQNQDVN